MKCKVDSEKGIVTYLRKELIKKKRKWKTNACGGIPELKKMLLIEQDKKKYGRA